VALATGGACVLATLTFAFLSRGPSPQRSAADGVVKPTAPVPQPYDYDDDAEYGVEKFDTAAANTADYEAAPACGHCMWARCRTNRCGQWFPDNQPDGYARNFCMCGCCRRQCGFPRFCHAGVPYISEGWRTRVTTLALSGSPLLLPAQTAVSDDGATLYVADELGHSVRSVDMATGEVRTLAGTGEMGAEDGTGTAATFRNPRGLARIPGSSPAKLVVADTGNNRLRLLTLGDGGGAPSVTTLAGSGEEDIADGFGTNSAFAFPKGLAATDAFVLVADSGNDAIRMVTFDDRLTTTVAGEYEQPPHDGPLDGLGSAARFSQPTGIALSADESRAFVADAGNNAIRAIDMVSFEVTTLAGTGKHGVAEGHDSSFFVPSDLALHADGEHLQLVDSKNRLVRMLDLRRCDSAGRKCYTSASAGFPGVPGAADGVGPAARFGLANAISALPDSNVDEARFAVSDGELKSIRLVTISRKDERA